jgi:hypothetical protein
MYLSILIESRFGIVVEILAYYARGRGFDHRTLQTFVCMNMSVCIGSECFLCIITYISLHFIPEGVAEVSQIFLRDTHVLPK